MLVRLTAGRTPNTLADIDLTSSSNSTAPQRGDRRRGCFLG